VPAPSDQTPVPPTSSAPTADPTAPWHPPTPVGLTGPVEEVLADAPSTGPVRIVTLAEGADGTPEITVTVAPDRARAADAVEAARAIDGALAVTVDQRVTAAEVGEPTPVTEGTADAHATASAAGAPPLSNDALRNQQWGLTTLGGETAWQTQTGIGQTVAVIDSGVDGAHPDLAGQVLPGIDLVDVGGDGRVDPHGHGTHVAGIIAAIAGNLDGIAGLAPGANILPVRVLDAQGSGWNSAVADGIIWAADHGAATLNLSLGGPGSDSVLASAVSYAQSKNVLVVAAAGNERVNGNATSYPAAYPGVVGVAATDEANASGTFSNTGSYVDLAAPGVNIVSTYPANSYAAISGTSMATPYAAAAAALIRATKTSLTADQVAATLVGTVRDLGAAGRDDEFGAGLIDPVAALQTAQGDAPVVRPGAPGSVTAQAGNASATVSWAAAAANGSPITRYTVTASPGGATATSTGATTATVTGLANGTAYRFTVTATNAVGTGPASTPSAASTPVAPGVDRLSAGQQLFSGQRLTSPNGQYTLVMQADGNLVVWAPGSRPIWDTRSWGNAGARMAVQADGNLVVWAADRRVLWHSDTWGQSGGRLVLQDDGNVVLTNSGGTAIWQTGADRGAGVPKDTLQAAQQLTAGLRLTSPDGRYTLAMQTDGNLVVWAPGPRAIWDTRTWNRPGARLKVQADGNLVLWTTDRRVLWHSDTWGEPGGRLVLQDDGNLVLTNGSGTPVWQTGVDRGAGVPNDTVQAPQQLTAGLRLTSPDGRHYLLMQDDGNLVVRAPGSRPIWDTRTWNRPGARLKVQVDGNLVLHAPDRRLLWQSDTSGNPGSLLVLQNDGAVVLYASDGRALWSSVSGRTN
jgi:serine protease